MGRVATKASSNVWYQARMNASQYNDKLASREGTAELLGMSVSAISDAELGISKVMPVDKAVLMADVYNAPQLLNYYCKHECPIGKGRPLADELDTIERATIGLLLAMDTDTMADTKVRLMEIAEDGKVSGDELGELEKVMAYLNKLAERISAVTVIAETVMKNERANLGRAE